MMTPSNALDRAERYRAAGWWTGESIVDRLRRVVEDRPAAPAVTSPTDRLTYGELWDGAGALGEHLDLPPAAVVLIVLPNGVDWVLAHAMIGRRGWVPASIPSTTTAGHLAHAVERAGIALVLTDGDHRTIAEEAVAAAGTGAGVATIDGGRLTVGIAPARRGPGPVLPDDVGQLFFTSSTTGPPKAVVHSHDTLGAMHTTMAGRFALAADTPIFMPSPFGHSVGGMHGVRLAQWIGAELVTMPSWEVGPAIELAETHRPQFTAAATPFLVDLVRAPAPEGVTKFESVRWFLCGGAPVPPELVRQARAEMPGTTVTALWGMTEGGVTTCGAESTPRQLEHTVGTPMPGLELAVIDGAGVIAAAGDGELVMRGPAVFTGYAGEGDLYRDSIVGDGWFRTGDLAHLDAEGYLAITGRVKDLVIRGGVNISPLDTENCLMAHPAVQAAAVIGWPDDRLGERLCAVVEFAGPPLTLDELIAHCRASALATRSLPERLVVVDGFPRTAAGKIRKNQLREELLGGLVHHVPLGDIDVCYRVWGSGPPVVLVHGLAEDAGSWRPIAPGLTGRTVYAYDLRGHGGTTIGAADGTLAQLGGDLIAFLATVTGPAPVVGFSLGGTVVLWAAAERPDLVTHAVAVGTSSVVGRGAAEFFRTRIGQLRSGDRSGFEASFAQDNAGMIAGGADPAPVLAQRLAAIGDGAGYVNAATAMVGLHAEPLTPRLAGVTGPADVIAGSEDAFCPPKASQMILDALPDGRLHTVAGSGHLVAVDRPAELTRLLDDLLTSRAAGDTDPKGTRT